MKKYVIILAAAVLGLVFSCNDKLDLTTDGRISRGEIFQDRYKIMGWLNGCYNYCPGVSLTRAGYTDETHHSDAGTSNGQNYYNFYQGSTSSSNWYGPDNPWESLFQGIRKCNIFITGMQVNTLPGNVTQKDKEQWMGEAYTMRALYYWQLVKRYGGVPIIKEELGVDHDFSSDRRAIFSGTWNAEPVKEALGDNFGATQLPTITIDGEAKQMRSFAGSKAIGVNPNCQNMQAAIALAVYLGSAEAQKAHYEMRGIVPTSKALSNDATVSADIVAMAQANTIANTSVLQATLPEMGSYWTPSENMGKAIVSGEVTLDNAAEKTEAYNNALNNASM